MNKIGYYILMMATLSLGACSEGKDEPVVAQPTDKGQPVVSQDNPIPTEGDPIAFTARFDDGKANTKAITYKNETNIVYGITDFHDGIEDNGDLQQEGFGFGVYAYYTKDKQIGVDDFVGDPEHREKVNQTDKVIVMLNQKVEWKDGKWTYTPMHFWPGNQNYMTFFAYAPWSDTNHPYIGTENEEYEKTSERPYYHFKFLKDIVIPTSSWLFTNQEDLVWGMNGATGLPYKNVRRPDTKTASTPEGTLGWEFKHALARVKFTIFNLKDLFDNPSMIIANETPVINKEKDPPYDNEGTVGQHGSVEVNTYIPNPEKPILNEYYIQLKENEDNTSLCHKFEDIGDNSEILIITGVTFENVVESADFSHDNTTPYEPKWTNKEVYGQDDVPAYDIAPSLLNQTIYMDNATLSLLPSNYDYTLLPGLRAKTVPLTKPSGAGMDDKTHYFLFVPTKDSLEITIKYKIVRGYKLTGYYTWIGENTPPTPLPAMGDFTMIGIQGQAAPESTSTIKVTIKDDQEQVLGFEANKSYHVAMRLGKMLQVLFEVTDWDVPQSITINVPSFD